MGQITLQHLAREGTYLRGLAHMLGQDDEVDERLWVAAVLEMQGDTRRVGSAPPGPRIGLLTSL